VRLSGCLPEHAGQALPCCQPQPLAHLPVAGKAAPACEPLHTASLVMRACPSHSHKPWPLPITLPIRQVRAAASLWVGMLCLAAATTASKQATRGAQASRVGSWCHKSIAALTLTGEAGACWMARGAGCEAIAASHMPPSSSATSQPITWPELISIGCKCGTQVLRIGPQLLPITIF